MDDPSVDDIDDLSVDGVSVHDVSDVYMVLSRSAFMSTTSLTVRVSVCCDGSRCVVRPRASSKATLPRLLSSAVAPLLPSVRTM